MILAVPELRKKNVNLEDIASASFCNPNCHYCWSNTVNFALKLFLWIKVFFQINKSALKLFLWIKAVVQRKRESTTACHEHLYLQP
ncbi:hypothetical protein Y1Q_0021899 [Alligator mississippiensis]|uniref:Uncharacterized protein n=1 Tax=Alligator mississippiensis TaxID=8496 RepID=A0A151M615_ALLMI|nr:hypothetical protein Y1Q_0021899 [Alligator mississippiensis]